MLLKNVFGFLDRIFIRSFNVDFNREPLYLSRRDDVEQKDNFLYEMNIIDSKSSALLTHISIMFVVLGLFLEMKDNGRIFEIILVAEFVAYVLAALLLLRCVDIMGPPFKMPPEEHRELIKAFFLETTLRREIYVRALRMVFILTIILIPIILFKFFF